MWSGYLDVKLASHNRKKSFFFKFEMQKISATLVQFEYQLQNWRSIFNKVLENLMWSGYLDVKLAGHNRKKSFFFKFEMQKISAALVLFEYQIIDLVLHI